MSENVAAEFTAGNLAKLTAESGGQLTERLETLQTLFGRELDLLSETQFAFSPGEGQWSVSEVCRHVANSQSGVAKISVSLAGGIVPEPTFYSSIKNVADDPGTPGGHRVIIAESFAEAIRSAQRQRGRCNLDAVFPHEWFGEGNCRKWLAFDIIHMGAHINQIRRVKSADGFPIG